MGGGYYSLDIAYSNRSSGAFAFDAGQGGTAGQRTGVHPALNPLGKVREVNNETPIIVALDVTRSRGDDTKLMYEKLPALMGQLELKGWIKGPGISFAGIGDAYADRAPLQVGQFEADNRLDEVLERIWIEEGGGGTGQESYELAAFFYSRTNCVRLAQGLGGKGFCFFVGDEGFYPKVDRTQVRRLIGDDLPEDLDSAEAFARLQQKFQTFLIYPRKTMAERKANIDAEIRDRVTRMGGMYAGVDFRASLLWDNRNDLDLHVMTPGGFRIYYGAKQSPCGGWLDVDMNVAGDSLKPVENVRWAKGKAPAGRYQVMVRNFRYHEPDQGPTPYKVEVEVNGTIHHFEGVFPEKGPTSGQSEILVGTFDFDPAQVVEESAPNVYDAYSDDVVLGQWATVIPKEHILKVGDPKAIIDVLMGALAIANGAIDLPGYMSDLRERETDAERIADVESALSPLGRVASVPAAEVAGTVPSFGEAAPKRTTRI
jgi:hypothetical protein